MSTNEQPEVPKTDVNLGGSGQTANPDPHAAKPPAGKSNGFSALFSLVPRSLSLAKAAVIALFGLIFYFLVVQFQLLDLVLPSTYGTVVVDTPQIFTRERLVNDRFREEAWLESQLQSLTDNQPVIASRDSYLNQLNLILDGAEQAQGTERDKFTAALEKLAANNTPQNAPLFPDQFQKLQRYRDLVRRQLIENDLDDRHDLRSNSLFLFKFGASIAPGPRTSSPVRITLNLEEGNARRPLGKMSDDKVFPPCLNLTEYECAFLYKSKRFEYVKGDASFKAAEAYLDDISKSYDDWYGLYVQWIRDENSRLKRRQQEYRDLLSDPNQFSAAQERAEADFALWGAEFNKSLQLLNARLKLPELKSCNSWKQSDDIITTIQTILPGHKSYKGHVRESIQNCIISIKDQYSNLSGTVVENAYKEAELKAVAFRSSKLTPADMLDSLVAGALSVPTCAVDSLSKSRPASSTDSFSLSLENDVQKLSDTLSNCAENWIVERFTAQDVDRSNIPDGAISRAGNQITELTRYFFMVPVAPQDCQSKYDESSYMPFFTSLRHFRLTKTPTSEEQIKQWKVALTKFCETDQPEPLEFALLDPAPASFTRQFGSGDISWLNDEFFAELALGDIKYGYSLKAGSTPPEIGLFSPVPVGFFWFAKKLSGLQTTFSYAVSPRADFDLSAVSGTTSTDLEAALKGLVGAGTSRASYQQVHSLATVDRAHTVLGFSGGDGNLGLTFDPPSNCSSGNGKLPSCASFGWFILPKVDGRGGFGTARMQARNEGLSALISVPAWWKSVRVTGRADWLDSNFTPIPDRTGPPIDYLVDLPSRTDTLRSLLTDAQQVLPWVDQLKLGNMRFTACSAADFLLPGQRLWRSTVVTIGAQKSDLIQVMPDMGGIIVHYDTVMPQKLPADMYNGKTAVESHNPDSDIQLPIVVWTSEGHVALTTNVIVEIPKAVRNRLENGEPPCPKTEASPTSVKNVEAAR